MLSLALFWAGFAYTGLGKRSAKPMGRLAEAIDTRNHLEDLATLLLARNPAFVLGILNPDVPLLQKRPFCTEGKYRRCHGRNMVMHDEPLSNKIHVEPTIYDRNEKDWKPLLSRRVASHLLALGCLSGVAPAMSFDNAISQYVDYEKIPKRRGTAPKDLGVSKRTINADSINADPKTFEGLRTCDGKPNCFSTTGDDLPEDRILKGVDNLIQAWKPPADDASPFKSLVGVLKGYEPGQGFIDGGGFQVVKETDNYIYLQFESLKKGYIDDVEFFLSDGMVQVRSGSRIGQTDFAVNAKRLNYIADALRKSGWTISDITDKTHPDYFYAALDAADQTFDADRRKGTGLEGGRMDRPQVG